MVDVASIIISLISFATALLSAGLTGWFTIYSDERKRLSESEKLVAKYRDPLLLAARDLQSRLYNILDRGFLRNFDDAPKESTDIGLLCYTSFLVGQYLAWIYVLRQKAQFYCFSTDKDNKELVRILDQIQDEFSADIYGAPFTLWRGSQMAIGEEMIVKDDSELFCMGYSAFYRKWTENKEFRAWFKTIETGITERRSNELDIRLRRLQHFLLDVIFVLDTKGLQRGGPAYIYCRAERKNCKCSNCKARDPQGACPPRGRFCCV